MTEKITDKDLEYLEYLTENHVEGEWVKGAELTLKIAKAVKELQDT